MINNNTEADDYITITGNVFSDMMFRFWTDFKCIVNLVLTITSDAFDYRGWRLDFRVIAIVMVVREIYDCRSDVGTTMSKRQ